METQNLEFLSLMEEDEGPYFSKSERPGTFENLKAWQYGHQFVLEVYRLTAKFPMEERFGLTNQFRRAAVSIAANIAEGTGKNSIKDMIRFLMISRGSIEECQYFLILSRDLDIITLLEFQKLKEVLDNTGKLLNGLIKSLEKKNS